MAYTDSTSTLVFIILSVSVFVSIETSESIYENCNTSGIIFNCSGVGLLEIPEQINIPQYMETLDLSHNHISNVTLLDYPAMSSKLSTLDLSNNQISVLKTNAFQFLNQLVQLDLSQNLVSGRNLDERMFSDLTKLLYLDMEKNPIRYLKKDIFNFMELPAIKSLDLSHCEINEIETSSIDLPSLEWLDLSWNELKTFSRDMFRMLSSLKTLDMSHNRLTVLNEVPYMPELVTWILDSNGMEEIAIREEIEDYADKLQKLYLRNNNILRFDANSLSLELEDLQVIDMSNGRLHCDCNMRWIKSEEYDFTEKHYTFTCSYPSNLRNNDLLAVAPEDLKCGYPLSKTLFIVIVSTVVAISAALVAFFLIRRRRRRKRQRKAPRGDKGGDYTTVYTRDHENAMVVISDRRYLLKNETGVEFDV